MILLDTCALLYLAAAPDRLSAQACGLVASSEQIVHCSSIVAAELACLQEREKIYLPQHWKKWFRTQTDRNGWNIVPISLEIIEEAYSLPSPIHRDPADRIIIATARIENLTIITTDRLILDYPHVKSLS
jgi:PIN domain nuclease of toxin-antitoxin system